MKKIFKFLLLCIIIFINLFSSAFLFGYLGLGKIVIFIANVLFGFLFSFTVSKRKDRKIGKLSFCMIAIVYAFIVTYLVFTYMGLFTA